MLLELLKFKNSSPGRHQTHLFGSLFVSLSDEVFGFHIQHETQEFMKTQQISRLHFLVFLLLGWMGANAQTTLESEVPGDNFSLEGALELFKKSSSPEEFEKMLNSADSRVNNLDLNGDGNIDYMRVIDRNEGNVHLFIIQAALSKTESQDVAVIELEKLGNGKAVLQITGDADVYGVETIIEPTEEVRVYAGTTTTHTVVNVWAWPSVQYVYGPYYSVWVSPWRWAFYPFWWHPWRPVAYYVYDPWWTPYHSYYAVCYSHRIGYMTQYYRPYRSTSVIVYNNYHHQIDRYRSGNGNRNRHDGRIVNNGDRYDGRIGGSRDGSNSRGDNQHLNNRYQSNAYGSRRELRSDASNSNYHDRLDKGHSRSTFGSGDKQQPRNNFSGSQNDKISYQDKLNKRHSGSTSRNVDKQESFNDFKNSPKNDDNYAKVNKFRSQSSHTNDDRQVPSNDFKSSTNRKQLNTGIKQNQSPVRQNSTQGQRHESKQTFNRGSHQQSSKSQSVGGSSNRSPKSSGGGHGGRGGQRGRH
jgi:hypothetical protein